jgi:hypothetical protein
VKDRSVKFVPHRTVVALVVSAVSPLSHGGLMQRWFRSWCAFALCLVWLHAAPLVAQPTAAERAEASRLFQEGNADYVAGRWDEAIENFDEANAIAPNPRLLEYIGRCYIHLEQYGQALSYYEQFAATSEEAAAEVEERLRDLRAMTARASLDAARYGVRASVAHARGEQPRPRSFYRQEIGLNIRDVQVQILSTPRGADVYIDELSLGPVGVTPLTTPLFTGRHLIEVRKDWYESARQIVAITPLAAGESIPVFQFRLRRIRVPVSVEVQPPTTNVTFIGDDGDIVRMGTGRWSGELPAGPGAFLLQQGSRERRVERVIEPDDGQTVPIALYMVDPVERSSVAVQLGRLIIVSQSSVGEIFVNGERVGASPGEVELDMRAGTHTVELRAPGFRTWSQEVVVGGGAETRVYAAPLSRR